MSELLPCPFCGGEVELVGINVQRQKMMFVCGKCNAEVVLTDDVEWNYRHYPPEVEKAVERMKPVVIKPEKTDEYHPCGDEFYLVRCPDCGKEFKLLGFKYSTDVRHCGCCGKAFTLDWSNDE